MKITLIAPAGKREPAMDILNKALVVLHTHLPNVVVNWDAQMFSDAEPYHANTDEARFEQLITALNSDADAIWCTGGGYGCARLLPKLQASIKPKKQKLFIGFSDITALHLFLSQEWGWRTVHGIVFRQLNLLAHKQLSPLSGRKIFRLLDGESSASIPKLKPLNKAATADGLCIDAFVTGGNLSLIQTLLGTPWAMDGRNKIICLEDVAEAGYKVDRLLNHLWQAGAFAEAKAVVFGDFTKDVAKPEDVIYALRRFAASCPLPVFETKYFGHGKYNHPFLYNAKARLMRDKLSFLAI